MPKSFSIISEKQKLVPKKQELKQFVFLFEIIPKDFYVLFHKGKKTILLKHKNSQFLDIQGLKKS